MKTQAHVLKARRELTAAERKMERAQKSFDAVKKECNHTNRDGSSALVSGYFNTSCPICGWDDFGPSA